MSAACLLVAAAAAGNADPDLWGHLKFGLDMAAQRHLATADPYSYTAYGAPWINHEWLSELSFAAFYQLGVPGLNWLRLLVTAALAGIYGFALWRSRMPLLISAFLLLLGGYLLCPTGSFLHTVRPQLYTYLLFAVELALLQLSRKHVLCLYWLPVVFVLWVNLHGGFLAGAAVLALWVGASIIEATKQSGRLRSQAEPTHAGTDARDRTIPIVLFGRIALPTHLVAASAASLLACLINPYGWNLITFLLRTGTVSRPDIVEWHGLHVFVLEGAACLALFLPCLWALRKNWRSNLPAAVVLVACMLLPFKALRHIPLAVDAVIILGSGFLAPALRDCSPISFRRISLQAIERSAIVAAVMVLAAVIILFSRLPQLAVLHDPDDIPVAAVDLLARSGVRGNLACPFGWGEYCIWHLYPAMKVSMDGRRETVYDDRTFAQYLNFATGTGQWDSLLRQSDLALIDRHTCVFSLMLLKPDWQFVYADPQAAIFAPRDSKRAQAIRSALPPRFPALRAFP